MATRVTRTAGEYARALSELQDSVTRFARRLQGISVQSLFQAAVEIMSEAQERAPVYVGKPYTDKAGNPHGGHLRASAYVKINGQLVAQGEDHGAAFGWDTILPENGIAVAEIGFSAKYAFNQHEHVEYNHPGGGEAKYLEKAFYNKAPELLRLLKRAVEIEVKNGL